MKINKDILDVGVEDEAEILGADDETTTARAMVIKEKKATDRYLFTS